MTQADQDTFNKALQTFCDQCNLFDAKIKPLDKEKNNYFQIDLPSGSVVIFKQSGYVSEVDKLADKAMKESKI